MSIDTKSQILLDAWDFQGRPADRLKTGGWASAAMILCKYNLIIKVLEKILPTIICRRKGQKLSLAICFKMDLNIFLVGIVFYFSFLPDVSNSLKKLCKGIEAVERLTTLGIGVNLVTYLTGTMHLGNATAANTVTNFLGTSFMLCLLGGFIADTFLGRFVYR